MATSARSWNRWFGTMSRSAPVGVVEPAAAPDVHRLGDGDLHVVDVVAVPDRLEQAVGEAQHHDVLDRLLAEEMVHAVDLVLVHDGEELAVERPRRFEIGAERLFDDEPAPRLAVLVDEPGLPRRRAMGANASGGVAR